MTQSFDIDKYNSRECEVHNHGFYLGAQSKQAEIDELKQKYKVLYDREVEKHDENLVLKAHINELRCNRIVSDGEIDELRKQLELINQYTAAQGEAVKIANDERLELRKRIDERDKLINDFISDLDKTENENNSTSIHDYWRGFGSCAGSAKKILVERFNDLKGTTNE